MPLSWEMASGPTVGYEMAGQGSTHVAVDSSEGTTYSNFRLQDSTIRAFSSNPDNPMSANYRTLPFQDNVVRGLSTLSLYGQYNNDNNAEESPTDSHGKVCSTPSELYRYPSPSRVSPISSMGLVESSAFCPHALSNEGTCDTLLPVKVPYTIAHTIADERAAANNKERGFQLNNSYDFFNSFLGGNIDELKPIEDVDLETLSESSVSSGNCMQGASSSSDETLNALDETEIQSTDTEGQSVNAEAHSTVQEGTQLSCSIGTTFHRRRGLSQFYAERFL
ncbi:hypothetical protein KP509_02G023800 [Ceratopteris richardii]|uniref:Uncharacterized protein n=1 Tax=Ceratopteris richardii TaxID=49495 RepID=A0A8T2VB39_CERRI|nr:hypothetical protein KP509_02G023800 [Ceratopteris richardii]